MRRTASALFLFLVFAGTQFSVGAQDTSTPQTDADCSTTYIITTQFVLMPTSKEHPIPEVLQATLDVLSPQQVRICGGVPFATSNFAQQGGINDPSLIQQASHVEPAALDYLKPALCLELSQPQADAFLNRLRTDSRSTIISSPTSTLDSNHSFKIQDTTTRPIVTGVQEQVITTSTLNTTTRTPVLSVTEDGIELEVILNPLGDDTTSISTKITLHDLKEIVPVSIGKNADRDGTSNVEVTLQLPSSAVEVVEASGEIGIGQSYFVGIPGRTTVVRTEKRTAGKLFRKPVTGVQEQMVGVLITLKAQK
jgi:hypothetical protein